MQRLGAMFDSSPSSAASTLMSGRKRAPRDSAASLAVFSSSLSHIDDRLDLGALADDQSAALSAATVHIVPHRLVSRRTTLWRDMCVELVKTTAQERIDYSFHSSSHLLVAYVQGVRRDGDSCVDGLPRSTLRDLAKKLVFVPAGHRYHEWHDPRIPAHMTYVYFEPADSEFDLNGSPTTTAPSPRLFFEDATIWNTVEKLRQAVDGTDSVNELYVDAIGTILRHELFRFDKGSSRVEPLVKGGLATWQQRIVAAYIEEHLSEHVPLASLARLARLSTFHFCRAFKQSFGVPPHRYHTNRRIERAKVMLAERRHSVTEIGLAVGFCETSSFTAAFRKITGQSPSRYHRALL